MLKETRGSGEQGLVSFNIELGLIRIPSAEDDLPHEDGVVVESVAQYIFSSKIEYSEIEYSRLD